MVEKEGENTDEKSQKNLSERNEHSDESQDKGQSRESDVSKAGPSATQKIRKNPWILATIVLGVLAILLLVSSFGVQNGQYSKDEISSMAKDFFEEYGVQGVTVDSIEESNDSNDIYRLDMEYQGQTVPFYITKSGYLVGSQLVSIVPNEDGSYDLPGAGSIQRGSGSSTASNNTAVSNTTVAS